MGKQQFENQTRINAVTGRKVKVIEKIISATPLSTGVYERHTFFSSPRTVSRILNLYVGFSGSAGTTGSKFIMVDSYISPTSGQGIVTGQSNTPTETLALDNGQFLSNDSPTNIAKYKPADISALNERIFNTRFDETVGITIVFFHQCGVNISDTRTIKMIVEEEVIA